MSKAKHKFPLPAEAVFVGGPLDGDRLPRATNRFSGFRRVDGGRMGAYVQNRDWHQPLAELRYPKGGYKLELDFRRSSDRPAAWFVYFELWDQWLRDNMPAEDKAELAGLHKGVDAALKRHGIDPVEIDLDPLFAAHFLREFERDSRGVDAATYCQERRLDYIAAGVGDPDNWRDWFDRKRPVPFRDDWGSPQPQTASEGRKLKAIADEAPDLLEEVKAGRQSIGDAYRELSARNRAK
jgi:hypothetical protein